MSYIEDGPLPRWTPRDGGYETTCDGVTWRLWSTEAGWYLAAVSDLRQSELVQAGRGNLYRALDTAGLRVAADAVRADPEGARRQLDL